MIPLSIKNISTRALEEVLLQNFITVFFIYDYLLNTDYEKQKSKLD